MLTSILRSTGSIAISLIMALILVIAVEWLSSLLHPFPPGFDATSTAMYEHVGNYPIWVLALLGGAGWGITMLVATWLATRLGTGRHPAHGVVVGVILLAAVVFNMSMLPYPLWFMLLDLVLLPVAAYYGIRLGGKGNW